MFRDAAFPREFAYDAVGGPEYATDLFTSPGGYEYRRGHWPQSRGRWEVSFVNRTREEITPLLAFFRAVAEGRAFSFRFWDFTDDTFDNPIGTGDGTTTTFQLVKRYTSGLVHVDRILSKPVAGTLMVTVNEVPTTDYTLDPLTGQLTFPTPPVAGAVIGASGQFECMARFGSDHLPLQCVAPDVFSCTGLELVEVLDTEGTAPPLPPPVYVWQPSYRETFDYVTTFTPGTSGRQAPNQESWETLYTGDWDASPYVLKWSAEVQGVAVELGSGANVGLSVAIQDGSSLQIVRLNPSVPTEQCVALGPHGPYESATGFTSPFAIRLRTLLRVDPPVTITPGATGNHWIGCQWLRTNGPPGAPGQHLYAFMLESEVNTGQWEGWRYGYFTTTGVATQATFVTVAQGPLDYAGGTVLALWVEATNTFGPTYFSIHDVYVGPGTDFAALPRLLHVQTRLGDRTAAGVPTWTGSPTGGTSADFLGPTAALGTFAVTFDETLAAGYVRAESGDYTHWYGYAADMFRLQDQWTPLVGTGSLLFRLDYTQTPGRQAGYLLRRSPNTGLPDYPAPHPIEEGRQRALWKVQASVGTQAAYPGLFCLGQDVSSSMDWAAVGLLVEFLQPSATYTRVLLVQWVDFQTDWTVLAEAPWSHAMAAPVAMELEWHRAEGAPDLTLVARLGGDLAYRDLSEVLTWTGPNPLPFPSVGDGPVLFLGYDGAADAVLDVGLDQVELDELVESG